MKIFKSFVLIAVLMLASNYLCAKPMVLVSIKPLGLLVQDLLGDLAEVEVLLPGNADPHHYSLKISDRRKIQRADLVIWMGPEFERFLTKPLSGVKHDGKLSLTSLEGYNYLDNRNGKDQSSLDPHFWLSPKNAISINEIVAAKFESIYPELKDSISESLEQQKVQLRQLDEKLSLSFDPHRSSGFIADHDAYQSIASTYYLQQLAVLEKHVDIAPSVQHLKSIDEVVSIQSPKCFLAEHGHKSPALNQWANRWGLKVVTIDILGTQQKIDSYHALIGSVQESLLRCLAP